MLHASKAIRLFLESSRNEFNQDLIERVLTHGTNLEIQANVSGKGGELVDGTTSTYTDGCDRWHSFRIPKGANSEPHWRDYPLCFPIEKHVEDIGSTGWLWASKLSLWVAFDIDSILGHAEGVGISETELLKVRKAVSNLDYVEVRRSTSGAGLHLYVFLPDGTTTQNHNEHAAVARAVLVGISKDIGFDLSDSVDVCGSNMWIWSRRATIENRGFELLKPATSKYPHDLGNWREHLTKTSTPRTRVAATDSDDPDDIFTQLASEVQLDDQHRAVINGLMEFNGTTILNQDEQVLHTHTALLKRLHDLGNIRGSFETESRGSNLNAPNCFAYLMADGAFRVVRFGKGTPEHASWKQDGKGWTSTTYNKDETSIVGPQTKRLKNIMDALGNTARVDGDKIQFDGDVIHVIPRGTIFVSHKGKGEVSETLALEPWAKKYCPRLLQRAEADIWGDTVEQTDSARLAREVAKQSQAVQMHGQNFAFNGKGYEEIDLSIWLTAEVQKIIDADGRTLDDDWGIRRKNPNVGSRIVSDCKPHLLNLLPIVDHYGVDLEGTQDLSHVANYANGLWLAEEDRIVQPNARYFVRPALTVNYVDGTPTPRFTAFLDQILPEAEQQALAQEWAGAIMTGDRRAQKLLMLFGKPRSGKGTLTEVFKLLVGEKQYQGFSPDSLTYSFGLQDLQNRLLALVNEVKSAKSGLIEMLKATSGNDSLTVHVKYGKSYIGKLSANWVLTSNEICQFEDSSSVIITRLCGLFFQNSFEGREDPQLLQALRAELPGIAEWAREGYRRFLRNRMTFTFNPFAAEFLRNMRDETSPISAFVGECCEVVPGGRVSKDDLYGAYSDFALGNLETPLSKNRFSRELFSIAHGVKRSNCKTFYDNITLRA